ncbi:hypothetical protein [Shewanella surugensis]|uniref:Uncharacterized protein n=1 Tax=Shewanella surugensis TaxID=212020 RepID=A0ABT0LKU3_9GAMM|nr:hypothetical protein [Shewanella surugensis]MCL1127917.1 hypothetical protein [Shewanella surugensis]
MSVTTKALDNMSQMVGGWSPFRPLDDEDYLIFDEAMTNFVGVSYTPHQVSTQVVNGTNYRFECEAKVVSPSAAIEHALVQIYKPLEGKAQLVSITIENEHSSNSQALYGGWSPWGPLTAESLEVFDAATSRLLGVKYTPLEVSTQVVAGVNYRFICEARVVIPHAQPYRVMMEIFQPLEGEPIITNIRTIA